MASSTPPYDFSCGPCYHSTKHALYRMCPTATDAECNAAATELKDCDGPSQLKKCAATLSAMGKQRSETAHVVDALFVSTLAANLNDESAPALALRLVTRRNAPSHKLFDNVAMTQLFRAAADDSSVGQVNAVHTLANIVAVSGDAELVLKARRQFLRSFLLSAADVRDASALGMAFSTMRDVEVPLSAAHAADVIRTLNEARGSSVVARTALCGCVFGLFRFPKSRVALLEAGVLDALRGIVSLLSDTPNCARDGVQHILAHGGAAGAGIASTAAQFNAPMALKPMAHSRPGDSGTGDASPQSSARNRGDQTQRSERQDVDKVAPGLKFEVSNNETGECSVCRQSVEGSGDCLVLGHAFGRHVVHDRCFVCTECDCEFGDLYWQFRGRLLCRKDYLREAGLVCHACNEVVSDVMVRAMGFVWHPAHFVCTTCAKPFTSEGYYRHGEMPYCAVHVAEKMRLNCGACGKPVTGGVRANDANYHEQCFVCTTCQLPFGGDGFFIVDDKPYCRVDAVKAKTRPPQCERCGELIVEGVVISAMDKKWHSDCFVCFAPGCGVNVEKIGFYAKNGVPYCKDHREFAAETCQRCNQALSKRSGKVYSALGRKYHEACFVCSDPACGEPFGDKGFYDVDGVPYCETHGLARRGSDNDASDIDTGEED